jgi:hypothetical protein
MFFFTDFVGLKERVLSAVVFSTPLEGTVLPNVVAFE